jgi:predicted porin
MLMKKSLIALAVAGALTASMVAQADATLYGSFRVALMSAEDQDLDLRDESTRIGIKGDVDLGLEGTKGLFHWEGQLETTDADAYDAGTGPFAARLSYLGMTGDWGTALAGRQYHPHYLWVNLPTDVLNTATSDAGEWAQLGNNYHKRQDNTLAYLSPVMGGFQAALGLVIAADGTDADGDFDEDVDGYNLAAKYAANGLYVAASYGNVDTNVGGADVEVDTWGIAAKYTIDAFTVAAKYEDQETETNGVKTNDSDVVELAGIYNFGDGLSAKLRYSEKEVNGADGDQWAAEVEQKLGKGRVYVGYFDFDSGAEAMNAKYLDRLAIGYRVDF